MNYAAFVKIAADDVSSLRRVDVFRVIDSCPREHLQGLSDWLRKHRPDLTGEISNCVREVIGCD